MLSETFYWVLNISIIGGLAGLVVSLVRKIPRFPRFAAYTLWLLPLVRFWVPFGVANRWSLLSLISQHTTRTVVIWEKAPGFPSTTMSNFAQAAESYFPVVYKTELLKSVFETASIIWAIIAAAAILTSIFLYALTKSELRDARHWEGNVWVSTKVTTPAVYGMIKPRIIVPDWISQTTLPYILAHEQVHIKRRDNLWRVVAVLTACIHWFNPLCWLFIKWFFTDMELACDAEVLKTMGNHTAKDYAAALLTCNCGAITGLSFRPTGEHEGLTCNCGAIAGQSLHPTGEDEGLSDVTGRSHFSSAFGKSKTRMRIESILSYKKLTVISSVAFGALIVAISFVLITNAVGG